MKEHLEFEDSKHHAKLTFNEKRYIREHMKVGEYAKEANRRLRHDSSKLLNGSPDLEELCCPEVKHDAESLAFKNHSW